LELTTASVLKPHQQKPHIYGAMLAFGRPYQYLLFNHESWQSDQLRELRCWLSVHCCAVINCVLMTSHRPLHNSVLWWFC